MKKNNDILILNKLDKTYKRFDIVVVNYNNTKLVKRIIGMPGETVYINEKGDIYINDELLEESYVKEVIRYRGRAEEPITLGEDEYFVMGDNRNGSSDSREEDVGNISRNEIIGRAWVRIYPFDQIGVLKHQ